MKTVKVGKIVPINDVLDTASSKFNTLSKETLNEILKSLVANAHLELDDG